MKKVLYSIVAAFLAISCANNKYEYPKHVVFIGVDGWSAVSFSKGGYPYIRSLMNEASWTLDKRCVFPTASAINWMSIFSGVSPEYHGYVRWDSRRPDITPAWTDERGEVPTIFRLERNAHPESDILVTFQWDVIRSLIDSTAVTTCIQFPQTEEGDWEEAKWAADYLKTNKPKFSFIYFGSLDATGHKYGWESEEYLSYSEHFDDIVKLLNDAVCEAGIEDDTVFIMTSDHGGHGRHHSTEYVDETLQTPFFIWGKGIRKGHHIEAPSVEMDVTATLAKLLGVEPIKHWTCRPIDEVFE